MSDLKKQNVNKTKRIMLVVFVTIVVIIVGALEYTHFGKFAEIKVNNKVKDELKYVYQQIKEQPKEIKQNIKIQKLEELQKINSEIVALIEIEGTNINYPVVQGNDNIYYMTHNYKKKKSKDGALFVDKDYDFGLPSTNLLIYGHNNIGSTEMFAELMKYKKESFYKKHKIINFITNEEEAQYEIISVFLSRVYYESETNVFRYYYFINANNKTDFDYYITNCKKASLYDIEATAKYGDSLMTLSTCEYSKSNGRLAVIARKIAN